MGKKVALAKVSGIYAITPDLGDTSLLLEQVDGALEAGVRWVQYRNKGADAELRRWQAEALVALCRDYDARLLINDDWELALSVGANGAHLGAEDGDIKAARARLGPDRILGASCYDSVVRAQAAQAAGADYVAFGSIFPSATKPKAVTAPLSVFADARAAGVDLPLVGIGGITMRNLPELRQTPADAAAIISDLFGTGEGTFGRPEVFARARELCRLFPST